MNLPVVTDPVWKDVVTGKRFIDFEFLATKIFLNRAKHELFRNNTPETIKKLAGEIHALFMQNINHPVVQRDIEKLRV